MIKSLQNSLNDADTERKDLQKKLEERELFLRKLEEEKNQLNKKVTALTKKQEDTAVDQGHLKSTLENKQKHEVEQEAIIKDLKDKISKFELEKSMSSKADKVKSNVVSKLETEKKELEEKVDKMKLQYDKAAIETKKTMTKLEEQHLKSKGSLDEVTAECQKKAEELRSATRKLQTTEKK